MRRYFPYYTIAFAVAFALFTLVLVKFPDFFTSIDSSVHLLILPLETPFWSNIFSIISDFGSLTGVVAGLLVVIVLYRHRPDIIARLVIALLGATVSAEYIKDLVQRLRPETLPWLPTITSYSFPSGHANESVVLYGFIGLLLYVHAPSRLRKNLALIIPACFILLIGFSRLALNYHYTSDVVGGYLLGAFWLMFSLSIPIYHDVYHQNAIHSEPIERPVL